MRRRCWLADLPGAGACDGRLVRVHLIARQVLKRELPRARALAAIDDPRSFVWGCGGPTGVGGHHGQLDYARSLRVPRWRLPEGTERLAVELGLVWWLDREYGVLSASDAAPTVLRVPTTTEGFHDGG